MNILVTGGAGFMQIQNFVLNFILPTREQLGECPTPTEDDTA